MTTSVSDNALVANGTEQTIDTITTAGSFAIEVDTNAMASGDKMVLRVKTKVRSVGTTRLVYTSELYANVQVEPVKVSPPVPSTNEIVFTLEQTAGTNRTYPWEIVSL